MQIHGHFINSHRIELIRNEVFVWCLAGNHNCWHLFEYRYRPPIEDLDILDHPICGVGSLAPEFWNHSKPPLPQDSTIWKCSKCWGRLCNMKEYEFTQIEPRLYPDNLRSGAAR